MERYMADLAAWQVLSARVRIGAVGQAAANRQSVACCIYCAA